VRKISPRTGIRSPDRPARSEVAIPTTVSRPPESKAEIGIAQSSEMFRNSAPISVKGNNSSLIHGFQNRLRFKQPLIQRNLEAISQGLKQPGREADHSLHSNAEGENIWSYISTPKTRLYSLKKDGITVYKSQ
jgi:hypothetical protein